MSYIAKEDLKKIIETEPKKVVKVSVLPDRANIKLDTSASTTFFCSLRNPEGEQELEELIKHLKDNKATFILYNRRGNYKAYIERGIEMKRHDLRNGKKVNKPSSEVKKDNDFDINVAAKGSGKDWTFEGISVPVNGTVYPSKIQKYIPKEKFYLPPKPVVKKAVACLINNQPILFEGHTGVGKTELVKYLAAKTNNVLIHIQGSEDMEVSTILGHTEIDENGTFWVDGLLTLAVKEGFWLYFDEINACPAGVKIAIHNLLDDSKYLVLADNRGERIEAHPNFRFVAACNPADHGAYVGAGQENLAFLNRFCKIRIPYMDAATEKKLLKKLYSDVDSGVVDKLVQSANMVRKNFTEDRIMGVITTRDLKIICESMQYLSLDEAISLVMGKFSMEDGKNALDCFEQHFGKLVECGEAIKL